MRTLDELLKTPRMYFAPLDDNNSVAGLLDMVNDIVKPDFVIVEIGSFAGVSSDLFARYCKTLHCVDIWKDSPGFNNYQLDLAFSMFLEVRKKHENIYWYVMTSFETSKHTLNESIDLVYIDAIHDYECVKTDIEAWTPKVKSGGWVTGHDIHMPGVLQAVTEAFDNDYKTYKDESWAHQKK